MVSSAGKDTLRILANILRLEKRRGFRDDAVIGGLDAFLQRRESEIDSSVGDSCLVCRHEGDQRSHWIADTLSKLDAIGNSPATSAEAASITAAQSPSEPAVVPGPVDHPIEREVASPRPAQAEKSRNAPRKTPALAQAARCEAGNQAR